MSKKIILGQFFTRESSWLKPQVADFIAKSGAGIAYDPFAGSGCLLNTVTEAGLVKSTVGLDIDPSLGWKINDSLVSIPHVDGAAIVTNPPYISNYSAARKKIIAQLQKYFDSTEYDDLYLLALDRMLDAQETVVAIVPETFINSSYRRKDRLYSITVLEDNPFTDTDTPVAVLCFDGTSKELDKVKVYRNGDYVDTLGNLESMRLTPSGELPVVFNDPAGWLAVRCVDTTDPKKPLEFGTKETIPYDWAGGIKVSSRLVTLVSVNIPQRDRGRFICVCNRLLREFRERTSDLVLSPFKGNMKDNRRRRRLDYCTCRALIEGAYREIYGD